MLYTAFLFAICSTSVSIRSGGGGVGGEGGGSGGDGSDIIGVGRKETWSFGPLSVTGIMRCLHTTAS